MKQFASRLLVFCVWPVLVLFITAMFVAACLIIWPMLLWTPVRFEDGEIKVGEAE